MGRLHLIRGLQYVCAKAGSRLSTKNVILFKMKYFCKKALFFNRRIAGVSFSPK